MPLRSLLSRRSTTTSFDAPTLVRRIYLCESWPSPPSCWLYGRHGTGKLGEVQPLSSQMGWLGPRCDPMCLFHCASVVMVVTPAPCERRACYRIDAVACTELALDVEEPSLQGRFGDQQFARQLGLCGTVYEEPQETDVGVVQAPVVVSDQVFCRSRRQDHFPERQQRAPQRRAPPGNRTWRGSLRPPMRGRSRRRMREARRPEGEGRWWGRASIGGGSPKPLPRPEALRRRSPPPDGMSLISPLTPPRKSRHPPPTDLVSCG